MICRVCGFEITIDSEKCQACGATNEIEPTPSNDSIKTSVPSVVVNESKDENPNQSYEINAIPFGLEDAPFAPPKFGLPFDIDFAP